jgi:hypothetical protein
MDFLRRVLGGGRDTDEDATLPPDDRQSVAVLLRLTDPELTDDREQLRVYALEDRLMRALDESGAGTHETNDLERGFLRIQLLGPDADRIVGIVRPLLDSAPPGSYLAVRRGPPGATEERLDLTEQRTAERAK